MKGTPGHDKVVSAFGPEILNKDGEVNRRALGAIVFNDEVRLTEQMLHGGHLRLI